MNPRWREPGSCRQRTITQLPAAVLLLAVGVAISGCRAPAPHSMGCGSDQDCKLERLCEMGRCIWPTESAASQGAAGAAGVPGKGTSKQATTSAARSAAGADQGPASAAVWMFRGDAQHRGRSAHLLPRARPDVVWKYKTAGPIFSSPAVLADGSIAIGSHDRMVHVVDPIGEKRFALATGDLIFGSPALDATGKVYIGSDDDHLYALDLATLTLSWRLRLGTCSESRGVGPEASRCDAQGGPTMGPDGTLYVGSDGVYAITPDGTVKWHFATGGRVVAAPALLPDGTVVAGSQDDTFYAISPDGQKRWDYKTGGDIESSAAIGPDGAIYFGSDDHKVYALGASGDLLWAFSTGGEVRASPALGRDGRILIGSFDGLFYAIDKNGTLDWNFRTGDRIASSALVDPNGTVVFGSQDDRLYAVESDGTLRWSLELGGDIDSSPVAAPDGSLLVGADDGYLYMLRGE